MRRWLVSVVLGAFLAFVGVQAAHSHDSAAAPADSCAVCALAQQAQRQAPAGAPRIVVVRTCTLLVIPAESFDGVPVPLRARARAPPSAS